MGMRDKMMEFMMGRMGKMSKEKKEKMMGMMGGGKDRGGMMDIMSQMMPRMMENCLTPMSEEQRRNMLTFCHKMLKEMEEKFLTQK